MNATHVLRKHYFPRFCSNNSETAKPVKENRNNSTSKMGPAFQRYTKDKFVAQCLVLKSWGMPRSPNYIFKNSNQTMTDSALDPETDISTNIKLEDLPFRLKVGVCHVSQITLSKYRPNIHSLCVDSTDRYWEVQH
jgi:hypothetical protein